MDKLEANNWIQTPVWTAEDGAQARVVCFRKRLFRENTGASFPVRITAAGRYKLYVNGCLTQFGPLKGDGAKCFVDAMDLAPALREGETRSLSRCSAIQWTGKGAITVCSALTVPSCMWTASVRRVGPAA